jgi:septal ring factor EnvC (AmiA/AmiB activator)
MTDPTTVAVAVDAMKGVPSGDPVIDAAKWGALLIVVLLVGAVPLTRLINMRVKDRNENKLETAISDSGSTLYKQLVEQMNEYRRIADEAFKERNCLVKEVAELRNKVTELESIKETNDRLRDRIEQKDGQIRALLEQNSIERTRFLDALNAKDQFIVELHRQVSDVRDRLVVDEKRIETALAQSTGPNSSGVPGDA